MSDIAITKDIIRSIIPSPNLNDLSNNQSEIDNDITILLEWLSPYFPPNLLTTTSNINKDGFPTIYNKFPEPSQRIKAAIRSCLKDEHNQLEFIRLYLNSINGKFNEFFQSPIMVGNKLSFLQFIDMIKAIMYYFGIQSDYLNLTVSIKRVLIKKLSLLLSSFLIDKTNFIDEMGIYFNETLFKSPESANSLDLIDIITTLVSIDFTNQLNDIVIKLSIKRINHYIVQNCTCVWDKPLLQDINNFIEREIFPSFSIVINYSTSPQHPGNHQVDNSFLLYDLIRIADDELVSLRIKEIYSLILKFPNTYHALNDLHECLSQKFNHRDFNKIPYSYNSQAFQRTKLVEMFIKKCEDNLLHSGANTIDVITTYTKTIKSFLIIDPKGVLLDKVVRPIRKYLKFRDDIIIKLVYGFLDDNHETNELYELAQELRRPSRSPKMLQQQHEEDNSLNWVPDPIDALPDFKKGKLEDIIESLISIFNSKEIFIDEFTKLFGQKLIKFKDINEIESNLNLLKLRFGKNNFTTLDIMIRDIKQSQLLQQEADAQNYNTDNIVFSSSVLSHLYWPSVLEEINNVNFNVPTIIQQKFESFKQTYSKIKPGRTLKFVPNLGLVKLNIEFKKQNIAYEVSPDKAAIISLFSEQESELSVSYISKTLNMSEYMASKGLSYWVKEGILMELTKTLYIVNEEDDDANGDIMAFSNATSSNNSATQKSADIGNNRFGELNQLESHIITMLQNITSLPGERIKTLLKIMVPKEKIDINNVSDSSLEEYLDYLVEENKLELKNGNYNLKKN
ncbi:uncharacterized protein J8A68_000739 [[Candida] subhashii]|uniref:Cullin family profile domain-containing protein n=1 Tax=[Candida] subhashii TaxID=561895 RepID=A0A8J5V554_9ASCO|nr:uncharacterized protein J8A68_000739 [[Candida] subhashii]KAG7665719.1 hypothetical protein J8A68_000739 [[Candida] subhashii]